MFMALLRKEISKRKMKDVILIAVVAKPKKYESWQIQNNAQESLEELINMDKHNIINQYYIINNDSKKTFKEINEEHYLLFDRWIEGEKANNENNADESERMDLFKQKGQAMMFEFSCEDDNSFKSSLQKAYDNSIYCHPLKNPDGIGIALNQKISEEVAFLNTEDIIGAFPKIHNTPTDSSNMIMLIKSKENKAIKNEIIEIANEKAEKINNESTEDIENVDLKK